MAASRSRYEELIALIELLDQRQDHVLIETALVELSGRDFYDVGVELRLADIPGAGALGGFGVTTFGLSSIEDLDGDGVPDSKVPGVAGGITAGILDGDDFSLPVLLRLVELRRNSNVLNVPSVLVNDNDTARIESLEERPTADVTIPGLGQTVTSFGDYQSAGVPRTITPSIAASRFLRLVITLEASSFLGAEVGPMPPPASSASSRRPSTSPTAMRW